MIQKNRHHSGCLFFIIQSLLNVEIYVIDKHIGNLRVEVRACTPRDFFAFKFVRIPGAVPFFVMVEDIMRKLTKLAA